MAAPLLRRGYDPVRVAELTQVPLALVELLAEHPCGDWPSTRTGWHYVEMSRPWATPQPTPQPMAPARASGWWPLRAILPILTNLVLVLDAVASHRPVLAAGCVIAAVPLLVFSALMMRRS